MKTQYTLLAIGLLLACTLSYAQTYTPSEKKVQIDGQMTNAWVIQIEEPAQALKKSYVKYAKEQLDVKVKKSGKDLLVSKEILVPAIAKNQGDLKVKFFTEDGQTAIAMAFMPGYDFALNSVENTQEMDNLRKYTKNFVKYYKTNQYNEMISSDERQESKLRAALKKDQNEYRSLNKRVPKVEKMLASDKTKADKLIHLKNENIANRAQLLALDEIIDNLEREIVEVNENIQQNRAAISSLELQFAENAVPVATQEP